MTKNNIISNITSGHRILSVRTATRLSQWWYVTRIQLIGSKSIYSGESYLWAAVTLPRHARPK